MLYTGWSLVFSEDDFTVRQFNLATANCNQIDTRKAMHWHTLAKVMPILDIRRTIVSITKEQVLYTGWSLVFSEDDFTVRQFNLATANCNQIDTRKAMHWHTLAKVMPILDIRRTIVSITKEQVLYTGWSLVFSEDEICATASDRLQSRATPWHSPESI